ncbi:D-isomer specific 2-hydroxyacid dehydrogenase family protein [Afifella sp. IM 167]|uniref:NAD(P)-dependent oxidoreductase n=1 Tax=Afifella sp. IM 167 TaxID=2033586 RepID=UPI001CC99324|nr:NAD(P)-dependent oxidoreductase [Afifella sp. IM 167]MBZ8131955.1 phosphoglycerate dehydrogenase [Afifella sp. IM 167]
MKILKTAPGLDPHGQLAQALGPEHTVAEADFGKPLEAQVADVDVFLTRDVPITDKVIDAAPKLRLVQRYGHHVVNVCVEHAASRGVPVASIPSSVSGSNIAVAEHAFFLMMALAKRLVESDRALAANRLGRPETTILSGKVLGLVGIGGTGAELARMARAFGMTVIATKRDLTNLDGAEPHLAETIPLDRRAELLARADYVSIHLPLNAHTTGYVDAAFLEQMRPEAFLVNIARGEVVDRDALLAALTRGTIAGAGIDVFWDEQNFDFAAFRDVPNLVATPHIAGASVDCLARLAEAAATNIRLVGEGRPPLYEVNSG